MEGAVEVVKTNGEAGESAKKAVGGVLDANAGENGERDATKTSGGGGPSPADSSSEEFFEAREDADESIQSDLDAHTPEGCASVAESLKNEELEKVEESDTTNQIESKQAGESCVQIDAPSDNSVKASDCDTSAEKEAETKQKVASETKLEPSEKPPTQEKPLEEQIEAKPVPAPRTAKPATEIMDWADIVEEQEAAKELESRSEAVQERIQLADPTLVVTKLETIEEVTQPEPLSVGEPDEIETRVEEECVDEKALDQVDKPANAEGLGEADEKEVTSASLEDYVSEGEAEFEGEAPEPEDGAEEETEKEVDPALNFRDPQFIPRKTKYFLHDSRLSDDSDEKKGEKTEVAEEGPTTASVPSKSRRRPVPPAGDADVKQTPAAVATSEHERWGHDFFDCDRQRPKTEQEISQWRTDNGRATRAPRGSRRRRRFGRPPYSGGYYQEEQQQQQYTSRAKPRTNQKQENYPQASRGARFSRGRSDRSRRRRTRPNVRQDEPEHTEEPVSEENFHTEVTLTKSTANVKRNVKAKLSDEGYSAAGHSSRARRAPRGQAQQAEGDTSTSKADNSRPRNRRRPVPKLDATDEGYNRASNEGDNAEDYGVDEIQPNNAKETRDLRQVIQERRSHAPAERSHNHQQQSSRRGGTRNSSQRGKSGNASNRVNNNYNNQYREERDSPRASLDTTASSGNYNAQDKSSYAGAHSQNSQAGAPFKYPSRVFHRRGRRRGAETFGSRNNASSADYANSGSGQDVPSRGSWNNEPQAAAPPSKGNVRRYEGKKSERSQVEKAGGEANVIPNYDNDYPEVGDGKTKKEGVNTPAPLVWVDKKEAGQVNSPSAGGSSKSQSVTYQARSTISNATINQSVNQKSSSSYRYENENFYNSSQSGGARPSAAFQSAYHHQQQSNRNAPARGENGYSRRHYGNRY